MLQNWCGPTNYLGRHSHAAIEVKAIIHVAAKHVVIGHCLTDRVPNFTALRKPTTGIARCCARRERPRRRSAADERDKVAPLHLRGHSITSSARGRPSALAVLRLMVNASFVICWTGRSAGFSPL